MRIKKFSEEQEKEQNTHTSVYKYCLTYDVENGESLDNTFLSDSNKRKLYISGLLKQKGAQNIDSPVASTITFTEKSSSPTYSKWERFLDEHLKSIDVEGVKTNVFFYFCLVARITSPFKQLEVDNPDTNLSRAFKEEFENFSANDFSF